MLSSSSVGDVPYTLGSTKGVKEALEPPPLPPPPPPPPPRPYCRVTDTYTADCELQRHQVVIEGGKRRRSQIKE